MKTAAVISEYNPFHSGHRYHLEKTREQGATHIICLMSGSVVQRGDIAVFTAHERAEAAIKGGADLVLELPPRVSLSPARDFARGAVNIIDRLGIVDVLSFGAEAPDIGVLSGLSRQIEENELKIKAAVSRGKTYPQAASEVLGESASAALTGQNNTLALEYIRALREAGSGVQPEAVQRTSEHDGEPTGGFASAGYIRRLLKEGKSVEDYAENMPKKSEAAFLENCEKALLFRLSMMNEDDFSALPYCDELAPRLYKASRRAESLKEIFSAAKSRNFTLSKLRRAVVSAAIGLRAEDSLYPEFTRVLALNERGAELLRVIKKRAGIAVGGSLIKLSEGSDEAKRQAQLIEAASRLRDLGTASGEGVSEYEKSPRVC